MLFQKQFCAYVHIIYIKRYILNATVNDVAHANKKQERRLSPNRHQQKEMNTIDIYAITQSEKNYETSIHIFRRYNMVHHVAQ